MPNYLPARVEPRWQQRWEAEQTFRCPDPQDPAVLGKPKVYLLDMFPYPSGAGLHVGHPEGYTATDILARMKRMQGYHVLHPMGWDAFGLPAEQYAIQTGTHPRDTTRKNIDTFRRQIKALGFSYDWRREVDTTDPTYVRWTQWIFLQIYDTYYDAEQGKGRPIAELPIPDDVRAGGEAAVAQYRDGFRLAYQAEVPVNWCPALGTVLANEEVIDGKSERGGHPVERRPLKQWLMRITAYADRLIDDLGPLDWSDSIKAMQRQWIGKSEGAEVRFSVQGSGDEISVFTTRPDTLFGATYLVLAPEHALVEKITTADRRAAVEAYKAKASRKSEFERTELAKEKTGEFTGAYAVNPANSEPVPIYVADYVLATYGTGAIMAVPGHDVRDFAFAQMFGLPIVTVVAPSAEWLTKTGSTVAELKAAFTDDGRAMNSGFLDGLGTVAAKAKMSEWLEERGSGKARVNYKLRDWLFSRQRYWGEPFPILHELDAAGNPTGVRIPVPESELPVKLPEIDDFKPTGTPEGPLSKATEWVEVTRDGKRYRRETNTMPQWAGSCWYYLRFCDPTNSETFADPAKLAHWLPVDLYVGGAEHAVLHLLYSRFWHKVLFDRGHVPTVEPFHRLVNQGMILGEAEYHVTPAVYEANRTLIEGKGLLAVHRPAPDAKKHDSYILKMPAADGGKPAELPDEVVEKRKGKTYLKDSDIEMTAQADKMSKSRDNVVNPDDVIERYGADSLRLYEMFMGPLEATKPWNMRSVEGVYRFLSRVWRLIIDDRAEAHTLSPAVVDGEPDAATKKLLHKTIKKVTEDTEGLRFNTGIAAMMELSNALGKLEARPKGVLETFVLILAPYAPHVAEELWEALGHSQSLAYEPWPSYDPALVRDDEVEVPVSVNGKVRAKLVVPADTAPAELEKLALAEPKVAEMLGGRTPKKVIVVPGKMVNVVG